jgi:cytochrome c2
MNKFILITATFGIPLLGFLVLKDASGALFRIDRSDELSYVVVEPEDLEPEVVEEPETEPQSEPEPEPEVEEAAAEAVEEEPAEQEAAEAPAAETTETEEAEEVAEAAPEDGAAEATDEVAEAASAEAATEEDAAETAEVADAAPAEGASEAADDAAAAGEEDAPAAEVAADALPALTEEELAAAQRSMRKCTACHQYERERNGVGPHLVGVIGRPVGSVEGYRYSDALLALGEEGAVWTQSEMIAWLEEPSAYADGTKMNFKVSNAEERRLIAGWLAAQE